MAFDPSEWEVVDAATEQPRPIQADFDPSEWEIAPEAPSQPQEELSTAEALTGGAMNAMQGFGLGWGDEAMGNVVGAGNYLANKAKNVFGGGRDLSLGESIDERTQAARELRDAVKKQNPKLATTAEVAGAVANPLSLLRLLKVAPAVGALPKIAGLTAEGAAQGAIYGAGAADEGSRLQGAKGGALFGAGAGGALGTAGTLLGKAAGLTKPMADAFERSAYGFSGQRANTKAFQRGGTAARLADENPINEALQDFKDMGATNTVKPKKLLDQARQQANELDDQLTEVLKNAEKNQGAIKVAPEWTNTQKFYDELDAADQAKYEDIILERMMQVEKKTGGNLLKLQEEKRAIYGKAKKSYGLDDPPLNKELDQAVAQDLKIAIEKGAEKLGTKGDALKVKQLNKKLGQRSELIKQFQKSFDTDQGKNFITSAYQTPFTTGGAGVGMLLSGLSGSALPVLAGLGLRALNTPKGKQLTSRGLNRLVTPGLEKAGGGFTTTRKSLLPLFMGTEKKPPLNEFANAEDNDPRGRFSFAPPQEENSVFNQMAEGGLDAYEKYLNEGETASNEENMKTDVDKLLDALIQTESAGNPKAVSPVGAKGLGQLMDKTGKAWADKLGVLYDPFDPEQNKQIAKLELASLLNKYEDPRLALAAYNWGQGNLDKLIKRKGTNEFEELEKSLPKETQQHNQRTLKFLA